MTCENGSGFRSCQENLVELHSKYSALLDSLQKNLINSSPNSHHLIDSHCTQNDRFAWQIHDEENFLQLVKCIEFLESNNEKLAARVERLEQDNADLREELVALKQKFVACEDNVIHLESEKQQLEFLLQLKDSEKDALISRLSENTEPLFNPDDLALPSSQAFKASIEDSPSIACSDGRNGLAKRRATMRFCDSKDNSPSVRGPPLKVQNGNYTMCMHQSMINGDDLDLEELTDKLSWHESIMRQLQEILGAHVDDPDASYHQESLKIVERAKRMVEYKSIIQDYEATISEQNETISRYKRAQEKLLRDNDALKGGNNGESQLKNVVSKGKKTSR